MEEQKIKQPINSESKDFEEIEFNNIKKIGVISDTHIPLKAEHIPEKALDIFKGCNLILHAGDLVNLRAIDELGKIAPVVAVKGNMDEFEHPFPKKIIITINNKLKIGIMHGYGSPNKITDYVKSEFKDVDCIVFGHSHKALNETLDNTLLFNPGSACDKAFTDINSVGILYIDEKIKGEIFKI
jgi:hypothetical protein